MSSRLSTLQRSGQARPYRPAARDDLLPSLTRPRSREVVGELFAGLPDAEREAIVGGSFAPSTPMEDRMRQRSNRRGALED